MFRWLLSKLKGTPGEVSSQRPRYYVPCSIERVLLPAVIGLVLRNLLYVPSLSCKAVLSVMLAVLCYVYGYGIVCLSISICGSIFVYYKWALLVYGCMRVLRV